LKKQKEDVERNKMQMAAWAFRELMRQFGSEPFLKYRKEQSNGEKKRR